jgi:uncharacterized membrane protein YtjA (UPF0391 family)
MASHLLSLILPEIFLEGIPMRDFGLLQLALVFLVIALIAALFSFGLVADFSFAAAKLIFFVFIVLALLSLLGGVFRRPPI